MRPPPGRPSPPQGKSPIEQARSYTTDVLGHEKSEERLIRVLKRVDALADQEIAGLQRTAEGRVDCRSGCDHCCYRVVGATVSEAVRIATQLKATASQEAQQLIIEKSRAYEELTFPYRSGKLHLARPACPLLVDHKCSVYEQRPLGCRGWNSRSVKACEMKRLHPDTAPLPPMDQRQNQVGHALSASHSVGIAELDMQHETVDLGTAIGALLEHPELVGQFLNGEKILMEHAMIGQGPDPIVEQLKRLRQRQEPSGYPPQTPNPGHAVFEFLRLSTPTFYASQQDIDKALRRYIRLVEDLAEQELDPVQAFDGLKEFQTFGLPYTGEDVTAILRQVGETIVYPIVAKALPDLVEPIEPRHTQGKIRVGYVSVNLRNQNGGRWSLGWLANHDDEFETFAICIGPWQDEVSLMFRAAADHYYYLPGDIPSSARFIKSLNLDVIIFPDIGNMGPNYQYAAMRLAPVQCTAWGQPVTSGLPTIDYYLSSELMEPPNGDSHYTEKLVRLPGSGLYLDSSISEPSRKTRAELGIPEGFVYLVAQNPRKLVPKWDSLFVEIQERTGAPMIFIDFKVEEVAEGTKQRLAKAGLKATWLPPLPEADFVRVQELCDVSLDPPAWHGGNTTVRGIEVGSPIVSLAGPFMRSRHSLAFLTQANLTGLIASSPEEYVALATDPERIKTIMANADPRGMLEDDRVTEALDEFLRRVARRS